AANNQRMIAQTWVVALFDCGVECVAIDMRNGQVPVRPLLDQARRSAIRAAPLSRSGACKAADAISAYESVGVHESSCASRRVRSARARMIVSGATFLCSANAINRFSFVAR